ncbi:MAG: alpha/beta hydrolase [Planctomycetota bacterium]|nr:alpha/beta hydrolase [Planctomycetota bacterium]
MGSRFIKTNGISVCIHRNRKHDLPPLLLLHGVTDSGRCWGTLPQLLSGHYDVIALDARGHGQSDAPVNGYRYRDFAADVAGVIEALGFDAAALLGHSMGAQTAAVVAADYPDLVSAMILEDPPWRDEDPEVDLEQRSLEIRKNMEVRKSQSLQQVIDSGKVQCPAWPDEEFQPWAQAKLQVSPNVAEIFKGLDEPWTETASRIKCPTLLVTGDVKLGAIVSPARAKKASKLMERSTTVRLPGAGHCIRRDQPAPYLREALGFLGQT